MRKREPSKDTIAFFPDNGERGWIFKLRASLGVVYRVDSMEASFLHDQLRADAKWQKTNRHPYIRHQLKEGPKGGRNQKVNGYGEGSQLGQRETWGVITLHGALTKMSLI